MAVLNPVLTSTPANPVVYNPNIAETYSWIPIDTQGNRPLYAKAMFDTSYKNCFGLAGLNILTAGKYTSGYVGVRTAASTTILSLTTVNNIFNGTLGLPADFVIYGLIKGIEFTGGPIIAYLQ